MKKLVFYGICILGIVGCFKLLELQYNHEKDRAITRCGSENNIVENFTKDGDSYWTCKVEKKIKKLLKKY